MIRSLPHFVLLMVLMCASTATAQTFTIWGAPHEAVGATTAEACQKQHGIISDLAQNHPEKIQIPNFLFVEGETPAAFLKSTKNFTGGGESQDIRTYIDLYGLTNKLVSEVYESFQMGQKVDPNEYLNILDAYHRHLESPMLNNIVKSVRNNPSNTFFQTIQGDFDARGKPVPQNPGPGFLHFIQSIVRHAPQPTELNTVLNAYLALSREVGVKYFAQVLAKKTQFNMTIDFPGSIYDQKKIFDVIDPTKLFVPNFFITFPRTKNEREMYLIFVSQWRNKYITSRIVELMKNNPTANILYWIGTKHVPAITNQLVSSKELTIQQKNKINVLSVDTQPQIACSASAVLNSIQTSTGASPLILWNQKYGTK